MKNIYIKKLVSLHPTVYELKQLEEMIIHYGFYCFMVSHIAEGSGRRSSYQEVKSFKRWLKTEI